LATPVLLGAALMGAFAGNAGAAELGVLETLTPSPVPLTALAVDPTTNMIYGLQFEGKRAFRYNPNTNAWSELPEAAIDIGNNGGATYLDGKIYMVSTSSGVPMEVYDIAAGTWSTFASPLGNSLGTADITNVGGELYLASALTFVKFNPMTEVTTTLAEPPAFIGGCAGSGFEPWGGLQVDDGLIYGDQGDGCRGFAVYDITSNSWSELPEMPAAEESEEGPVAGSAFDPVAQSYFAYGGYGGHTLFRYNVPSNEWTEYTLPFAVNDGGLVYVSEAGRRGIYAIQGQAGAEFIRYTTPEPSSDLVASATVQPAFATVGGELTYTLAVVNNGPYGTGGVTLTSTLPADVELLSANPSQGNCSGAGPVSCALGTLADGASATVTLTVRALGSGSALASAKASSESPDPAPANNEASVTATITTTTTTTTTTTGSSNTTTATTASPQPAGVSAQVCSSERNEIVHWKVPRHVRLDHIVVTMDGHLYARLGAAARSVRISLVGLHGGAVTMQVIGATHTDRHYTTTRVFHPCETTPSRGALTSLYLLP
jgi:uncharacterized repeat protein (TIGR01451 family)